MIVLGNIVWDSANEPKIPITFEYEKQRSGADMQYRIKITISAVTGTKYFGYPIYFGWTIDGVNVSSVTLKTSWPSRWEDAIVYTTPWYTVANKSTGTTSLSLHVYSGQGSSRSEYYAYSMAVDPAASAISASNGTLGIPLDINVTRYNSAFKDTITYTCGNVTGTVCKGSTATSVTWDATNGNIESLAAQNTKGQYVKVTFTVHTYSGTTLVGQNSISIECYIPDTIKPSLELLVEDVNGYYNTYGAYVQGWSNLRITGTPTLAYGSPIEAFTVIADGKTYNDYSVVPVTTGVIQGKDAQQVTAAVRDSRSRSSGLVVKDIVVLEYSRPTVDVIAYRCDSDGNEDPGGAYMKVGFTATITGLNGKNSASYTISYGGEPIVGTGTSYTSDVIPCAASRVWSVEVTVTDDLDETTKTVVIPIAFTLMDFYYTGEGVALGKVATRNGFDCAMDAFFTGEVTVGGKTLLNLIYPVGSIYMSTNNVSPQVFFGGTWVQMTDRFLIGAGNTYSAGKTGGSATHVLTIDELPSHNHVVGTESGTITKDTAYIAGATGGAGARGTSTSDKTGGGAAHNNMPPYLAVYMWKRTK